MKYINFGVLGHNRMFSKPKFNLYLTDYEMDLLLKCIIIVYLNEEKNNKIFDINERDKDKLYYLHKVLSCKANEFFYNKINDDFFKINRL